MENKPVAILVALFLLGGAALAGNTVIQKGSVFTDVFTAAALTVEEISGHLLKGDIDAGSNTVKNLADPANPQDAATKAYVDRLAAAGAEVNVPDCSSLGYLPGGEGVFACGNKGCVDIKSEPTAQCCLETEFKGTACQMKWTMMGTAYSDCDETSGTGTCEVKIGDEEIYIGASIPSGSRYSYGCSAKDSILRDYDHPGSLVAEASCSQVTGPLPYTAGYTVTVEGSAEINASDHYTINGKCTANTNTGVGGSSSVQADCTCFLCKAS